MKLNLFIKEIIMFDILNENYETNRAEDEVLELLAEEFNMTNKSSERFLDTVASPTDIKLETGTTKREMNSLFLIADSLLNESLYEVLL